MQDIKEDTYIQKVSTRIKAHFKANSFSKGLKIADIIAGLDCDYIKKKITSQKPPELDLSII